MLAKISSTKKYSIIIAILITIIIAAHLYRLSDLPAGIYLDEGSVAINAVSIAASGVDEYGTPYPIYFRAFSEYKNPIYIYLTALIFRIFGMSVFNLRLTSSIFYFGGLAFSLLLVSKLFARRRIIEVYTLITLGFLPMYFLISRIAFEVISQFTWIAAANYFCWLTFHDESASSKKSHIWASICGLLIGTSIYTYTTARLLSLLMIISVWAIYFSRAHLKKLILITAFFLVSLLPYVYFVVSNPGAITSRFRIVSYLYWDISWLEKIKIFVVNYMTYISPRFIFNIGDPNWRHTTSVGGIVFAYCFVLFVLGVIALVRQGGAIDKFSTFLIVNLIVSPVAGSLTFESIPQSLRVHLLAYYIVILSCYGLQTILSIADINLGKLLTSCLSVILVYELVGYQIDFYGAYPVRSIRAMESFSMQQALQHSLDQNPGRVVYINAPRDSYANFRFYSYLLKNEDNIPVEMSENPTLNAGDCVVYPWWSEGLVDDVPHSFEEFQSKHNPNAVERILGVEPAGGIMKARCYQE